MIFWYGVMLLWCDAMWFECYVMWCNVVCYDVAYYGVINLWRDVILWYADDVIQCDVAYLNREACWAESDIDLFEYLRAEQSIFWREGRFRLVLR